MRNDLRTARNVKNLTQQQVASAIGRDQAAVARYESGQTDVGKDIALALAEVLGMSVIDVLYPKPDPGSRRKPRKRAA